MSIPIISLVSMENARNHARTPTADDNDLRSKLVLATSIVMNYVKLTEIPSAWIISDDSPAAEFDPEDVTIVQTEDSPATVVQVPGNISSAVLLVLTELYENREASASDPISGAVKALLSQFFDPTFA